MKKTILNEMDELHFHPREDNEITEMVMQHLLESGFVRGIPILNYKEPIDTAQKLEKEQERLIKIAPNFEFIWSVMLTKETTPEIISDVHSIGVKVIKWIPEGLSTNSSKDGVGWKDLPEKYFCFKKAEKLKMGAMIHVEDSFCNDQGKPITHPLYREGLAIPKFNTLVKLFPGIIFTFEHVSTKRGVDYILNEAPDNVFGKITLQHLIGEIDNVYNRERNIIPDQWCMPIFKYWDDREALREAATGGSGKFFYGGDKAPHKNKNPQNPATGVYPGITDICILPDIFEQYGALNNLNDFVSGFGANCYGLPRNKGSITLQNEEWIPPEEVNGVKIFCGGKKLDWKVV